jgi:hypothetical protein
MRGDWWCAEVLATAGSVRSEKRARSNG